MRLISKIKGLFKKEQKPVVLIFENHRACGNSTRLIDYYIQLLFTNKGEPVQIKDHYKSRNSDQYLLNRVIKRLRSEHANVNYYACYKRLTLTILK